MCKKTALYIAKDQEVRFYPIGVKDGRQAMLGEICEWFRQQHAEGKFANYALIYDEEIQKRFGKGEK